MSSKYFLLCALTLAFIVPAFAPAFANDHEVRTEASRERSSIRRSDFLFAIVQFEGNSFVYIGTKEDWNNGRGGLSDCYSNEEYDVLGPVLDKLGLCELQESTYEPCGVPSRNLSPAALKRALIQEGLSFDPRFQKALQN